MNRLGLSLSSEAGEAGAGHFVAGALLLLFVQKNSKRKIALAKKVGTVWAASDNGSDLWYNEPATGEHRWNETRS